MPWIRDRHTGSLELREPSLDEPCDDVLPDGDDPTTCEWTPNAVERAGLVNVYGEAAVAKLWPERKAKVA